MVIGRVTYICISYLGWYVWKPEKPGYIPHVQTFTFIILIIVFSKERLSQESYLRL